MLFDGPALSTRCAWLRIAWMRPEEESMMKAVIAAAATVLLAACSEIPQDAPKPFAGEEETKSYAGGEFDGDKALYEKTLAKRAATQNEYLRIPE
jgi:hypothetical protein